MVAQFKGLKVPSDPTKPIYDREKPRGNWQHRAAWVSGLLVTGTLVLVVLALSRHWSNAQTVILLLAGFWAVGAPAWFFFEYFYVYRLAAAPDSWDLFKPAQQVAIAIWAGLSATLYALGTSDLAKAERQEVKCSLTLPEAPSASAAVSLTVLLKCPAK